MPTKNILILLGAAVIIGLGAWYWSGMSTAPEGSSDSSSETADNADKQAESNDAVANPSSPGGASAQTTVDSGNSVESDLAEIDTLNSYESDYDDSDLDSTFSSEGANSLTQPYDY